MFGELMMPNEEGYDPEKDAPMTENLNADNMNMIVQTVFRKA
jgi:hypothetical protein